MADNPTYHVTLTPKGKWLWADRPGLAFAFIDATLEASLAARVTSAFETALGLFPALAAAVTAEHGSGAIAGGVYLLDQSAMTRAINTVPGIAMTKLEQDKLSVTATAAQANLDFFTGRLTDLVGEVKPLAPGLNQAMADLQAALGEAKGLSDFGILIATVGLMPVLNVPITTLQYISLGADQRPAFEAASCADAKTHRFDFRFSVADYSVSAAKP